MPRLTLKQANAIIEQALTKAHVDVSLSVLKGAGHGWDWKLTNDSVVTFFKRTLEV